MHCAAQCLNLAPSYACATGLDDELSVPAYRAWRPHTHNEHGQRAVCRPKTICTTARAWSTGRNMQHTDPLCVVVHTAGGQRRRVLSLPLLDEIDAASACGGADAGSVFLSTDRFMLITSCTQYVASAFSSASMCSRSSSAGASSSGDSLCPLRHSRICRIASGSKTDVQYCVAGVQWDALQDHGWGSVP